MDAEYAAAPYNLAMGHLVIRSREVGRWFEKVIENFPDHPDVHYKLGAYHEAGLVLEKDPNLEQAALAYQGQVDVNPDPGKTWFQLGSVLLKSGKADAAVHVWTRLMVERPNFRSRYLTQLIEVYQLAGKIREVGETAAEHISGLDDSTRALFSDISIIATEEERLTYQEMDRWERLAFTRLFWKKRDSSPATDENERRVEHYRRIIYAMHEFGQVRWPWDRRGEVYVRYGEPRHKSRWDNARFEFHPDVIRVKDRLQEQLPIAARQEIIARSRRISQSIRERESGTLDVGDFEGGEFELNANRRLYSSNERTEGNSYGTNSFTSLERMGPTRFGACRCIRSNRTSRGSTGSTHTSTMASRWSLFLRRTRRISTILGCLREVAPSHPRTLWSGPRGVRRQWLLQP